MSRGAATRADFGARWARILHFVVPVREPAFWARPDVERALLEALKFLTGDAFIFEFVRLSAASTQQASLFAGMPVTQFEAEEVMLFSGGIELSRGRRRDAVLRHWTGGSRDTSLGANLRRTSIVWSRS